MLRQSLLWLSERPAMFRFVRRNPVARRFADRFVAGETLDDATRAAERLHAAGITASLDLLGESVTRPEEAEAACREYVALLERLAATPAIEVNASVKLTQMGLDLDPELCRRNMVTILERARALGGFVRIDMESSAYTQRTLDLFESELFPAYGAHVGVVLQSSLRRSADDVARLAPRGARIRLCKGAYREPPEVAYPDKADVDRQYVALMERLLREGRYPAIATHDERILTRATGFAAREGIAADRFEFQMLFGVRRDLQASLRQAGHRMRVYVPFGSQWYPYLMRRLAERPANIVFMLGNLLREGVARRSIPK